MMRLAPPMPRRGRDAGVAMINVVFLLLIFFLMVAQIAPPDPLPVTPPEAGSPPAPPEARVLWIDAGGQIAQGDLRGAAALAAVGGPGPVLLRADAALPAARLAPILRDLGALGVTHVGLETLPGPGAR